MVTIGALAGAVNVQLHRFRRISRLTSKLTCKLVSGAAVAKASVEEAARAVTGNVRRMTRAASAAYC